MVPRVKITIVRRFSPEEVFGAEIRKRSGEKIPTCGYKDGREFLVDFDEVGWEKPEGLCGHAWHDMFEDVMVLYYGGDYEHLEEPNVIYSSCTDGTRPVVFKIERIES